LKQKQTLVCFETEEQIENPRYTTRPKLNTGGPGSEAPPPYLVTTGSTGHAVVGLDIGTKLSRIATFEEQQLSLLTSAPIPSLACRLQSGQLMIGMTPTSDTVNIIQDFRSLVGTDWYIEAECGFYSADMLTERLIKRLSVIAEDTLGRPVSKAVITTPVTYTSTQRKLLKAAGAEAGVEVLQLINEPTAAAFYHCYQNREFDGNLLVYHQGAGTFAVSVMEFHSSGLLEVKSTIGNDQLCSNSFAARLVSWMIDQFNNESGYILQKSPSTILRMMSAADQAISDLHTSGQAHIKVTNIDIEQKPGVSVGSKTHAYLMTNIKMKEYLSLIEPVVTESLGLVDKVLADAGVRGDKINQILMLGDSRGLLPFWNKFFERMPGATIQPCSPSTYPVYGAALQAALISNSVRDFVVWDIINEPVFVEEHGNLKQVIARGTPIPMTAYHKCESPDSTVNMNVRQGSPNVPVVATLAELTISNCPPTMEGETKVEVHIIANADGIIDYRARHIGLDSMLPVSIIDGQPVEAVNGWSDTKRTRKFDEDRLNRLSRKMNMPPLTVLNVLRLKNYSIDEIKNGRAIEDMLRKLKKERLEKYA
jgi:molecular chaperone DnaK